MGHTVLLPSAVLILVIVIFFVMLRSRLSHLSGPALDSILNTRGSGLKTKARI
jgi:hypothetical protein